MPKGGSSTESLFYVIHHKVIRTWSGMDYTNQNDRLKITEPERDTTSLKTQFN